MSDNNWETQPRKTNGEFTFRSQNDLVKTIAQKALEKMRDEEIRKTTKGGSYGYLRKIIAGNKKYEIHHMPAASISPLTKWNGPCIIMSKKDHKNTSSYGKSKKAARYRSWQAKLISQGKFLEAERMDIINIQRKFGDRYNKSIVEKLDYEEKLVKEGIIYG